MPLKGEECDNACEVLEQAIKALKEKDSIKLKELSNQTIHSASTDQNPGIITSAVLIYTLSKLVERKDYTKIKNWEKFVTKFNRILKLAMDALKKRNIEAYKKHLQKARKSLESISGSLKPYIKEILTKASINKSSKLYEHGISLGQTAKLLGVTQWEITGYTGQRNIPDNKQNESIQVEKRAQIALEFFS